MHSVHVDDVGLPSPLLAEGQFVDCVISVRFSLGEKSKFVESKLVAEGNCSCANSP